MICFILKAESISGFHDLVTRFSGHFENKAQSSARWSGLHESNKIFITCKDEIYVIEDWTDGIHREVDRAEDDCN